MKQVDSDSLDIYFALNPLLRLYSQHSYSSLGCCAIPVLLDNTVSQLLRRVP